jgi:hypothetical protein
MIYWLFSGDPDSKTMYMVISGEPAEVEVFKFNEEHQPVYVGRLRRGQIFGQKYFITRQDVSN